MRVITILEHLRSTNLKTWRKTASHATCVGVQIRSATMNILVDDAKGRKYMSVQNAESQATASTVAGNDESSKTDPEGLQGIR
jgi:hypothetical protein